MKSFQSLNFTTILAMVLSALVAIVFASNANAQSSTAYNGGYQQQSSVARAEVLSVRDVELNTNEGGKSQVISSLLGGAIGAFLGQKSNSYAVAGIAGTLGTVLGGHVGGAIGNSVKAQELIIRFEDGKTVAITQSSSDGERFGPGQKVMIIGQGRVAPAPASM